MRYTPSSRDRYKNLVALLTGAATFGSVAATGAATGLAAHQSALRDRAREEADAFRVAAARATAGRAAQRIPWSPLTTLVKTRPQRTVVRTVVVHRASRAGVAAAGAGAPVSSPVYQPAPAASAPSGGSGGGSTVSRAPSPPRAPAPAPAPAPSSGS